MPRLWSRRRWEQRVRVLALALLATGALACGNDVAVDEIGPNGESLTLTCTGLSTDLVSRTGLSPDGVPDGYFAVTADGAFDALILVTVSDGRPAFQQQWDTLVGDDPVPPLGFAYKTGATTWVLAVMEDGRMVNDAAGRVSLAAGKHVLELVAGDSGYFAPRVSYRLYGHTSGTWIESNVADWP